MERAHPVSSQRCKASEREFFLLRANHARDICKETVWNPVKKISIRTCIPLKFKGVENRIILIIPFIALPEERKDSSYAELFLVPDFFIQL